MLEADVTAPGFVSGRFQLVHARFVLMHLSERDRLIAALAERVAPGGVLVLSRPGAGPSPAFTWAGVCCLWAGVGETMSGAHMP